MQSRRLTHITVAVMVLLSPLNLPNPVAPVYGRLDPPEIERRLLPTQRPVDLPRATISERSRPLPTPVLPDPDATPLPGPTKPPVATPVPTRPHATGTLILPVAGPITTYYSTGHPAIDIGAPCGTPLVAPVSGTVVYAGWKTNGGGYVVDIDAGWGLVSLNHLASISTTGYVTQGQVVGFVGATGWANGCHVHLALLVDGGWRNPLAYL